MMKSKKWMALVLCAVLALSLVACGTSGNNTQNDTTDDTTNSTTDDTTNDTGSTNSGTTDTDTSTDTGDGSTEIANPYVDCETLEEAGELAGFDISVPEEIDGGYTQGTIQAVENEMIQVTYTTEAGEEITLRKGTGTGDISGDYNEYAEENTLDVDGTSVTARGSDGLVYAATWTDGTYTYAITASAGLESDSVSALVPSIQ